MAFWGVESSEVTVSVYIHSTYFPVRSVVMSLEFDNSLLEYKNYKLNDTIFNLVLDPVMKPIPVDPGKSNLVVYAHSKDRWLGDKLHKPNIHYMDVTFSVKKLFQAEETKNILRIGGAEMTADGTGVFFDVAHRTSLGRTGKLENLKVIGNINVWDISV